MRSRRVVAAVVLSSQLGPPHMWRPSQLHDFLAYYAFLGVQRIHVPDRYGSLLPSLLPYMARGLVTYTRQPFLTPHHQPYLDQVPVLAAALMRERGLAEWVLSVDLDELLTLDHPYWAEGEGVRPPSDGCFHMPGDEGEEGEGCESMLGGFFAQPGFDAISLLVMPSVPQWGLSTQVNRTLAALFSEGGEAVSMAQTMEALAPYHPLSVWSRRSLAPEFHRFKCLFRPLHVQSITMHDVIPNERSLKDGITQPKVEAWHKYWGDAGLQRHKDTILSKAVLQGGPNNASFHPQLNLHTLLCESAIAARANVSGLNLSCCAQLTPDSGRHSLCFTRGEGFDRYGLAVLTPLFPTVLQSGVKSPPRPLLPVKLPAHTYGLELAVFGVHVSHVFCMYLHPRAWGNCTSAQLTWNKGPMWGEGKRNGNAFEAEERG